MPKTARIVIESNIRARVETDLSKRALSALDEVTSWMSPKAKFANGEKWQAFRARGWDGRNHLLMKVGMSFPIGLLRVAVEAIESCGYDVEVVDPRPFSKDKLNGFDEINLWDPRPEHKNERLKFRDYQAKSIKKAWRSERGILKIATGGGKTPITAAMAQMFGREGRPAKTVILLNKWQLARQTQRELSKMLGEEVGLIGGGEWDERRVSVAIIDTLSSKRFTKQRRALNKACDLLVVDECHHTGAKTWYRVIRNIRARFRFGLSGTPLDRNDGKDIMLVAATGDLVCEIKTKSLIEKGHLAKAIIHYREVHYPETIEDSPFHEAYELGVVTNKRFHRQVLRDVEEALDRKDKVMVLVQRIPHGKNLMRVIEGAEFVHYHSPDEEVDDAVKRFEAGKLKVLIASPIFREGINIPAIDSLVVADGGKSVIATLQKVGRALRPKKGKENVCHIYDYAHYTNKYLLGHAVERFDMYRSEGHKIVG